MANDVLKTLHDMEKELAEIKSAKEQVEAVVAADKTINKNLESYSSSLSNLSSKFRDVENSLKDVAKAVCEESGKFSSSIKERKNDIENATKRLSELLEEFKKQTEILGIKTIGERTETIHSTCEDLTKKSDKLLMELNDSQKKQDESLSILKTNQANLSTKNDDIASTCKQISQSLDETSKSLETKITDESKKVIDEVEKNCKENADKLDVKLTAIEAKIDNLQGDLDSLKNQQEATSKKIMKNVNINRWIIIAGIVILTVLLFVCK
ncbi:MAG: hypothetical protein KBT67_06730 [bacterium]|nr:hypothetical protein [Candidatus Limimorpha caballi]